MVRGVARGGMGECPSHLSSEERGKEKGKRRKRGGKGEREEERGWREGEKGEGRRKGKKERKEVMFHKKMTEKQAKIGKRGVFRDACPNQIGCDISRTIQFREKIRTP